MKLIEEYQFPKIKPKRIPYSADKFYSMNDTEKLKSVLEIVEKTIDGADDILLKAIYGGYEKDIDTMFNDMVRETYRILYGADRTSKVRPMIDYIIEINNALNEEIRRSSLAYFASDVMNMEINWHHLEWSWLVENFMMMCIQAARDHGKCLAPGTKVVMYDGTFKKVEDINVGDKVMGADSECRTVLSLHSGTDKMYEVKQSRGDNYIVNSKHILSIYKKYRDRRTPTLENVEIGEFKKLSPWHRTTFYRGYKVATHFSEKKIKIDPYYLGLWLGDGHKHNTSITSMDEEVYLFLKEYAQKLKLRLSINKKTKGNKGRNNKSRDYKICRVNGTNFNNKLLDKLRKYNVLNNKHIPNDFIFNTEEIRLQVLAGLVDSDGYVRDNCIYMGFKDKRLTKDLKRLADSLGFMTVYKKSKKFVKQINRYYTSYGLTISGDTYKIPTKIKRKQIIKNENLKNHKNPEKLNGLDITSLSSLKIKYKGVGKYYGFTLDGDGLFLLEDNTVTHNSFFFSNAYPIWMMYKYNPLSKDQRVLNGRHGFLFSNTMTQALDLLEIVKDQISDNEILREKLFPDYRDNWSKGSIKTKNGCRLRARSWYSTVRGAHPGYIILDDVLKDNVLYSKMQRDRGKAYFNGSIFPLLIPGGQMIIVGTPFHQEDLYSLFKKSIDFVYREYPAIDEAGNVLWSNRHNKADLEMRRRFQGTLIFTREYLVKPIGDGASMFPDRILKRAINGMDSFELVENIEAFPVKFKKVITGCDFAISSEVGADYTVFVTFGIDEMDNMWLLNVYRKKGVGFTEQKRMLRLIWHNFKPDVMFLEANQFQRIYTETIKEESSMPVKPFLTTSRKQNLQDGVPGLAILFENGKFRFPYGKNSKLTIDIIMDEFRSVGWTDHGIQGIGEHDDSVMAIWLARMASLYGSKNFLFDFVGDESMGMVA